MKHLRYSAVGVAAALLCHTVAAQNINTYSPAEATLPSINVTAGAPPHWEQIRHKESRVRAIGSESESTSLDTSASQHASVIDADEINRINAINTLDVLERVPGITVNRAGGLDGTIFLRGQSSSGFRVPMFIDGDRFRGRPAFQFMMVSPSELEQVEVIRGPASVRYGSDGLSGLVNFVTKKPKGTLGEKFTFQGGEADVTYRSNGNALQSNVSVEAAGNQFDLRVYASRRNANDYKTPAGKVFNSDYKTANAGIAVGYMPNANERYELSYRYGEINDGAVNSTTTSNKYVRRDPLSIQQLRLGYEGHFNDSWVKRIKGSLYGNVFETKIDTHTLTSSRHTIATNHVRGPNIFGGSLAFDLPTTHNVDTQFGFEFANDHWLGSRERTQVANTNGTHSDTGFIRNGREMTQSNVAAFALSEWHATPRWKLTGGARYDQYRTKTEIAFLNSNLLPIFEANNNAKTSAFTGSLGSSYFLTDTVELTGSYGNSFHMPWHSELFSAGWNATTNTYTLPNPELKPEYATTAEIGARFHLEKAYVDVSAYRTMYRNFMESTQTTYLGQNATQTNNVGKALIQGVEASGKWQLNERINLHGNVAYVHGSNRLTGRPLQGLAPWFGTIGTQYVGVGDAWAITGEIQFSKGQTRFDAANEYPASGYGVVNVFGQMQLDKLGFASRNTQLSVGITNLFDKQYRSASTSSNVKNPESMLNPLLNPGRSINLTLRTKF